MSHTPTATKKRQRDDGGATGDDNGADDDAETANLVVKARRAALARKRAEEQALSLHMLEQERGFVARVYEHVPEKARVALCTALVDRVLQAVPLDAAQHEWCGVVLSRTRLTELLNPYYIDISHYYIKERMINGTMSDGTKKSGVQVLVDGILKQHAPPPCDGLELYTKVGVADYVYDAVEVWARASKNGEVPRVEAARAAARAKRDAETRAREATWLRDEIAVVRSVYGDVPVATRAAFHACLLEWVLEDTPLDASIKTWRGIRLTYHQFKAFCSKHEIQVSRYFNTDTAREYYCQMRDGTLQNAVHVFVERVIDEFKLAPTTDLELFVVIDREDSVQRNETTEVWGRAL